MQYQDLHLGSQYSAQGRNPLEIIILSITVKPQVLISSSGICRYCDASKKNKNNPKPNNFHKKQNSSNKCLSNYGKSKKCQNRSLISPSGLCKYHRDNAKPPPWPLDPTNDSSCPSSFSDYLLNNVG